MFVAFAIAVLAQRALAQGRQPPPLEAQGGPSLRAIPLADVIGFVPPAPRLPLSTLLGFEPTGAEQQRVTLLDADEEPRWAPSGDEVVELLRTFRPGPRVDWDQTPLAVRGDLLTVSGTGDAVRATEAAIATFRDAFRIAIDVDAALYRVPPQLVCDVVVPLPQVESLVREQTVTEVWRARGTAWSGSPLLLERAERVPYAPDMQLEIAMDASSGVPLTRHLDLGVQFVVEAQALSSSPDVVLMCQYAFGDQREPLRPRPFAPTMPQLQVPSVQIDCGTCSGRLAPDAALVVTLAGEANGAPSHLLVVRARRATFEPKAAVQSGVFPIGAFVSGALRHPVVVSVGAGDLSVRPAEERASGPGAVDSDVLLDMLKEAIGREVFETDTSHVQILGDRFLLASEGLREVLGTALARFEQQWLHTMAVQLLVERDGGEPAHRVVLPALAGRWHAVVHGVETTTAEAVAGAIAQNAAALQPLVRQAFAGIAASLRPLPLATAPGIDADGLAMALADTSRYELGGAQHATLYASPVSRARFQHHGPLPKDGVLGLGTGPTLLGGGRREPTRLSLRVTTAR